MANIYGSTKGIPELVSFSESVAERTSGSVRIHFVNHWTSDTDRREETTAAVGVMRGWADLGWAGSRVFGKLGVRSLDPLQAPFLIGDYATQAAVWASGLPDEMLAALERIGLLGLAVLPGVLRKPFAFARPLVGVDDYQGLQIRTHESLVGEETFRALRATPVFLSAAEMARATPNRVDAMDIHPQAIVGWGYRGHVTWNVNFWPRTLAIFASRRAMLALGHDERQALRDSAQHAAARAVENLAAQERLDGEVDLSGTTVSIATEEDLSELRSRVEPVYEELHSHPETGSLMRRLETVSKG